MTFVSGRILTQKHRENLSKSAINSKTHHRFKKGNKINLGRKQSDEHKNKVREQIVNEKNYLWKGDDVSYSGLHKWIVRHKGNAKKCEHCGKEKTTPRSIQWANVSHKYLRDLTDYMELCVPCHKSYDLEKK